MIPRRTFLLGAALAPLARFCKSNPEDYRIDEPISAIWIRNRPRGGTVVARLIPNAHGIALFPQRVYFLKCGELHKHMIVGDSIPCGSRAEGA